MSLNIHISSVKYIQYSVSHRFWTSRSLPHYTVLDAPDKRKQSLQFKSSHVRLITKQPAAILRCLAARGSNFRHCILATVYNQDVKEHWFRYLARFASLQNIVGNLFNITHNMFADYSSIISYPRICLRERKYIFFCNLN